MKYKCKSCEKCFANRQNLDRHKVIHTGKKRFKCDICGKEFYWKCNLERHVVSHTGEGNVSCDICGKVFFTRYYLNEHMAVHTGERAFGCTVCGKEFYKKRDLVRHMSSHSVEKPFKCGVCFKGFARKDTLDNHMPTHTGQWNFKCSVCVKGFSKKSHLLRHMTMHEDKIDFTCDVCGKEFSSRLDLHSHKLTQHFSIEPNDQNYSDVYTSAVDSNQSENFEIHSRSSVAKYVECFLPEAVKIENESFRVQSEKEIQDVSSDHADVGNDRDFKCTECYKCFSEKSHLVRHMATHAVEKPFRCDVCFRGFTRKESLDYHMPTHTGAWSYTCGVCGKGFSKKSHLSRHMTLHTNRHTLNCGVCWEEFYSSSLLQRHMMAHHTVCNDQNESQSEKISDNDVIEPSTSEVNETESESHIMDHVECVLDESSTAEEEIEPESNSVEEDSEFRCRECDIVFTKPSDLAVHITLHDAEKPFKCEICFRLFTRKKYLVDHVPTHTGNWNFKCDICSKGFSRKSHLMRHIHMHTSKANLPKHIGGAWGCSCNVCGKGFSKKSHLLRHVLIHADKRNLSCGVCLEGFSSILDLQGHMMGQHTMLNKQYEKMSDNDDTTRASASENNETESDCPLIEHVECLLSESSMAENETDGTESESNTADLTDFACRECDKVFLSQSELVVHVALHEVDKPFKCEICFKLFSRKDSVVDHMPTHTGKWNFKCSICSKGVSKKSHLIRHMAKHTRKRKKLSLHVGALRHGCNLCGKGFSKKSLLLRHLLVHTDRHNLNCKVCLEKCPSMSDLQNHMISRHTLCHKEENQVEKTSDDETIGPSTSEMIHAVCESPIVDQVDCLLNEPMNGEEMNEPTNGEEMDVKDSEPNGIADPEEYRCRECNKTYLTMAHLMRHTASHTQGKPFRCDICFKGFSRKDSLVDHMPAHTGDWNFKCSICSKGFPKKSRLRRHMGVHTNKRNLKCIVCWEAFSTRSQLLRHMMAQYTSLNEENDMSDNYAGEPPKDDEMCEIQSSISALEHVECLLGEPVKVESEMLGLGLELSTAIYEHVSIDPLSTEQEHPVQIEQRESVNTSQEETAIFIKEEPFECDDVGVGVEESQHERLIDDANIEKQCDSDCENR